MFMTNLYIIHGWTYSVEPWEKTINLLKKSDINVKMLHVPGLTAPSEIVWTISDYVAWANEHLPDNAIALGHSNGGRILLNLCATHPDKLRHLVLLDSAGIFEPTLKKRLVKALAKLGKPLKKLPLLSKIFHRLTGSTDYEKAPVNMKKTLENMLVSDKSLDISKISTKTTILWGKKDQITPPRHAKILHAKIKNSTLKFYEGWTHAPYISHPNELARALTKLIKSEPES